MKPSVLIVGDRRKKGVAKGVAEHRKVLERLLDVQAIDLDEDVDLATAKADLLLVFGGDGSILHVARRLGSNTIPVLGVNYGHFGFLTDLEPDDVEDGIRSWLDGKHVTTERHRLRVALCRDDEPVLDTLAFNDVVVGRRGLGKMVDVDVGIDGRPAVTVSGDGLIVSTATGSTAHALAAGGPLIEPEAATVLLVPVAPHALSARPLVLSSDHRITLSIGGRRRGGRVTVDGGPSVGLGRGDRVDIEDADAPFTLVHASGRSFYDALRRKLGWRGRPRYGRKGREPWEELPETGGA